MAARARIPEPAKYTPTETKDSSKEEGGTTADAPKGSSDKGEVGGPGIDAGPSTVGKDKVAVEEKDTPAPAIEEKDPMVEDTPAEEGTGSKDKEGQGSAMSEVGLSESEPESPGPRGDEAAPEEPPPPPAPLPYMIGADFGFTTESTTVFMGLRCLADIERSFQY